MQKIIDEVVDQIAYEQLQKLRSEVKGAREEFERTIKTIKEYNSSLTKGASLKGAYTEMQQLAKAQRELKQSSDGLIKTNVELQRLEVQNQRLKTETARTEGVLAKNTQATTTQKQKDAALTRQITDEYKQLNAALKDAEVRYANLALTGNKGTAAAKVALQEALAIRKVLEGVDQSLRRGAFDARNLSRGLGNSMQQIFRELPVLALNAQTFFLAISNNLPIFFDAVSQAKAEIKAYNADLKQGAVEAGNVAKAQALAAGATEKQAIAAGKAATAQALANTQYQKAPSLLKLLTQNLFSYQTLLIAGVTLLTVYGKDLVDWAKGLFDGGKAAKFAAEELERLNKSQQDANKSAGEQIGKLSTLNNVLNSNTASAKAKKGAYDQLIKLYPSYEEQLRDEYEKTGQVAGVIQNVLVPAIIAAAQARAMQARIDDLAAKSLDAQNKQLAIGRKQNIAAAKEAAALARAGGEPSLLDIEQGNVDLGLISARKEVNNLKGEWQGLQKEVNNNTKAIQNYADQIVKNQPKLGSLTSDGIDAGTLARKEKAAKADKDYTDEYVKNLELRRKAEIDFA